MTPASMAAEPLPAAVAGIGAAACTNALSAGTGLSRRASSGLVKEASVAAAVRLADCAKTLVRFLVAAPQSAFLT